MKNKTFIGKLIEDEVRRQQLTITEFSEKICCSRKNVYDIFKREGIDTRLLERISFILHRNFFSLYCQEGSEDVENNSTK